MIENPVMEVLTPILCLLMAIYTAVVAVYFAHIGKEKVGAFIILLANLLIFIGVLM